MNATRIILIIVILFLSVGTTTVAQTVITETFDTGTLNASSETIISLSSGMWTFFQTSSSSGVSGYAVKLNSSTSTPGYIITPSIGTIASVSFYAKAGSAGKTMTVQKSVDGGPFVTVATPTLTSSFAQYTVELNDTSRNIRIKFMNTPGSGTSEYIDNVEITTVSQSIINLSPENLPNFGPIPVGSKSQSVSYTISGSFIGDTVRIQAPESFELSLDNSTYSTSLALVPEDSVIPPTQVYVRFSPTEAVGTVNGVIVHSAEGALSKVLPVSGIAVAQEPTTQPVISLGEVTGASVNLAVSGGDGMGVLVVVREGNAMTFTPMDGEVYVGIHQNYSQAIAIGDGNKIVYKGEPGSVTVTGLTAGVEYTIAAFAYNEGTNNSANFLTTAVPVVSVTTPTEPTMTVTPASIDFGNVVLTNSSVLSYTVSGMYLTPTEGTITITANNGFEISLSNSSGFTSTVEVPYASSTLQPTQIYVRFVPTEVQNYSGTIIHSGGGAPEATVTLVGVGVQHLVVSDAPIGFASLAGGVTGGSGGRTVIATNASELKAYLDTNEPLIVWVSGTIDISGMITLRSNKTILGMGSDARIRGGGFEMNRYSNVIIRNITFENSPDDCMKINQNSHHIWVDHCTFLDGPTFDPNSSHDGLFDITRQSDYITISYCFFYNHSKTMLIGHSDGETSDAGYLRTTIHHNWFKGTLQRHPRVRYGNVHAFNNYYDGNTIYGVASTCNAKVVVEGNYFRNVAYPIHVGYDASPWGYVNEVNNIYENCGTPVTDGRTGYKGTPVSNPHSWNPASDYSYTVDNPADIPSIVMANAGAGKIVLSVDEIQNENIPKKLILYQNYPNPFNPTTTIKYGVSEAGIVTVKIYDIVGRCVQTIVEHYHIPGIYTVHWNAANNASGVYFVSVQQGFQRAVRKIILTK